MIRILWLPAFAAGFVAWFIAAEIWVSPPSKPLAPSYVLIRTENDTQKGNGSGVHLGRGAILTAAHVVKDAKALTVEAADGQSSKALVIWQSDKYDIAMLELETPLRMEAAKLSCSEAPIGERLEGIGNPMGISFMHVWGRVARHSANDKNAVTQFIDITVAPGMSGGPLYNSSGKVAGIFDALMNMPIAPMLGAPLAITLMIPASAICHVTGRG